MGRRKEGQTISQEENPKMASRRFWGVGKRGPVEAVREGP